MRRGQIFSADLVLALLVVVAIIGLLLQGFDQFHDHTSSTVEAVKMQQIAVDAAAIKYYRGELLDASAAGYEVLDSPNEDSSACIVRTRGTQDAPVSVAVCRGSL